MAGLLREVFKCAKVVHGVFITDDDAQVDVALPDLAVIELDQESQRGQARLSMRGAKHRFALPRWLPCLNQRTTWNR